MEKEVVEMYKKMMYRKQKEVANLNAESNRGAYIGVFSGLMAIGAGIIAYLQKNFFYGVGGASLACGSYLFLRDAHRDGKKAEGLEKEIEAELGKEPELKEISQHRPAA